MTNREKLLKELNIDHDAPISDTYERLMCAALLGQGAKVTEEVLRKYNELKETLWGRNEEQENKDEGVK